MAKENIAMDNPTKKEEKGSITQREETNSAIGSWSGYIFQGLCGVLVVLRMLKENKEAYKDYSLQLDAYEDFSILDERDQIVSMHQCKSDKNRKNYDDEFKKMKAKVKSLATQGKLREPDNPQCYFHCNQEVAIDADYNVTAYQFETEKTFCKPGNIQSLIDVEVAELKNAETDTQAVRAALETIVNEDVLGTQQEYFDAPKTARLYIISRNKKIPFSRFVEVLDATIMRFNRGDFLIQMKQAYILGMETRAEEAEKEEEKKQVELFTKRLMELSDNEMIEFIQRVNPKDKLEDTYHCWHQMTSDERLNCLYRLVTEIPLDINALHWKTTNSMQTPSTLGSDMLMTKVCKQIYENQANLDFPWIYDWIVGHVDEHVEDIEESAHIINKLDTESQTNNIFHIKKVGILTKAEKKNGEFD